MIWAREEGFAMPFFLDTGDEVNAILGDNTLMISSSIEDEISFSFFIGSSVVCILATVLEPLLFTPMLGVEPREGNVLVALGEGGVVAEPLPNPPLMFFVNWEEV